MTRTAVLVGLPLSMTFVPGLQKAIAGLRISQPKAKDAELLEQIFIAGIKTVIDSPALTKERIARGR